MTYLDPFQFLFEKQSEYVEDGLVINVAWCPPVTAHPRHGHSSSGLLLLLAGDYVEEFGQGDTTIGQGMVRFRPEKLVHEHRTGPRGSVVLHLDFDGEWISREAGIDMGVRPFVRHLTHDGLASSLRIALGLASGRAMHVADDVVQLLAASFDLDYGELVPPPWLDRAFRLIYESNPCPATLSDVSRQVGISRMHLASTFRRFRGESVGQAIQARRVTAFIDQLLLSEKSLTAGAHAAGYYDASHATRSLRKLLGPDHGKTTDLHYARNSVRFSLVNQT